MRYRLARPLDKNEQGISVSFNTKYVYPVASPKHCNVLTSMTETPSHLGPFLFTLTLLPLLKKTAESYPGVRVVNVRRPLFAIVSSSRSLISPTLKSQSHRRCPQLRTFLYLPGSSLTLPSRSTRISVGRTTRSRTSLATVCHIRVLSRILSPD